MDSSCMCLCVPVQNCAAGSVCPRDNHRQRVHAGDVPELHGLACAGKIQQFVQLMMWALVHVCDVAILQPSSDLCLSTSAVLI